MGDGSEGSSGSYGQGHWRFPPAHRMVGYAYILTHPGIPCLFWPHAVRMPGGRAWGPSPLAPFAAIPDCLLVVYQCTRTQSLHPPP